jgi:hypothetical protein
MSETEAPAPATAPVDNTPPVTATSVKRERGSSPSQEQDQEQDQSSIEATSSKRIKGENGEAKAPEPVAAVKQEEKSSNGHPAQKMNDDRMEGWVILLVTTEVVC